MDLIRKTPSSRQEESADAKVEEQAGVTITALAELPQGTILDEGALANALQVSKRTVRRMVDRCEIPAGTKLGARKVWLSDKVLEYLAERAERETREARKVASRLRGEPICN